MIITGICFHIPIYFYISILYTKVKATSIFYRNKIISPSFLFFRHCQIYPLIYKNEKEGGKVNFFEKNFFCVFSFTVTAEQFCFFPPPNTIFSSCACPSASRLRPPSHPHTSPLQKTKKRRANSPLLCPKKSYFPANLSLCATASLSHRSFSA